MKIKVFEAFAGIGTQRMALDRLGIDHEVVAIAEIDKFAIKSYEAIHGETNNLGDISKIQSEDIPEHDLFTYSFPCQDISIAGRQDGLDQGSGTRSSLLWECNRVIETTKPKYLLMENVKNLVGKRHKPNFDKWLEHLEELGYTNYWDVLNAKDYGIPQNRERVFVISILGEHEPYNFPNKEVLTIRLRDILESDVDEKFYLSTFKTNELLSRFDGRVLEDSAKLNIVGNTSNTGHNSQNVYVDNGISPTIAARDYKGAKQVLTSVDYKIGAIRGRNPDNPKSREVGLETVQMLELNEKETSNCLTTVQKDNVVLEIYDDEPRCDRIGGIFDKSTNKHQAGSIYDSNGLSPTLDTMQGGWRQPSVMVGGGHSPMPTTDDFRIRKLTPQECWRLMGVMDEDFYKAQQVNSNSQLYKQAGNAIVVDVLVAIFRNLFG